MANIVLIPDTEDVQIVNTREFRFSNVPAIADPPDRENVPGDEVDVLIVTD